ncbi:hypothetical protein QJQ45_025091, partial [Haematococcus lacustris]
TCPLGLARTQHETGLLGGMVVEGTHTAEVLSLPPLVKPARRGKTFFTLGSVLRASETEQDAIASLVARDTQLIGSLLKLEKARVAAIEEDHRQQLQLVQQLSRQARHLHSSLQACKQPALPCPEPEDMDSLSKQHAEQEAVSPGFKPSCHTADHQPTSPAYLCCEALGTLLTSLREQLAEGQRAAAASLQATRQANHQLHSQVLAMRAAQADKERELQRGQAEIRHAQLLIARKHPSLSLPEALTAEEAAWQAHQAQVEEASHATAASAWGWGAPLPSELEAEEVAVGGQAGEVCEEEVRVMLCLLFPDAP